MVVVGGCGLVGFAGCGGFVVGVGQLVCVWSFFGQLGPLMILAWVNWIGFSLRFAVDLMVLGN